MTDEELAKFLGIENESKKDPFIAKLGPEKRALFEQMQKVAIEGELWAAGLGPKPLGALIDTVRSTRRRRAWK